MFAFCRHNLNNLSHKQCFYVWQKPWNLKKYVLSNENFKFESHNCGGVTSCPKYFFVAYTNSKYIQPYIYPLIITASAKMCEIIQMKCKYQKRSMEKKNLSHSIATLHIYIELLILCGIHDGNRLLEYWS